MQFHTRPNTTVRYQHERLFAQRALELFGLSGTSLRLLKYSNTALFRVATTKEQFVLRLHPPERMSEVALRSELDWLTVLDHTSKVWVPAPLAATNGQLLVTTQLPNSSDYRFGSLFRWMPGEHRILRLTAPDAFRMGQCLGELHAFADAYTPPASFARWKFVWGAFEEFLYEPTWFVLMPEDAELLARAVECIHITLTRFNEQSEEVGLIYGDTNLSNFRFNGTQVGLLDFEVCCFGPYLFDITRTLLGFEETGERAPQLAVAFHHGYRTVRSIPALDDPLLIAFKIVNVVDVIIWILQWDERMPQETASKRMNQAIQQLQVLLRTYH